MHVAFCEPTRAHADLVIPRGADNRVAVETILSRLKGLVDPYERQRFLAS
jgi:uridine kinase